MYTNYDKLSETQKQFVRSQKDVGRFIAANIRKEQRESEYARAPKRYEHKIDEHGKKFTVVLHAETNLQIGVLDGHAK